MASSELTFHQIRYVGKVGTGVFRMGESQLGWKGNASQFPRPFQWAGSELKAAEWHPHCGGGRALLKLVFQGKPASEIVRLADFQKGDLSQIKEHLQSRCKVTLEEHLPCTKGWSWGELQLKEEHSLCLSAGENVIMEIDVPELGQVSCTGKNELNLELQDGDQDEVLQGVRLFVPAGTLGEGVGTSAEQWKEDLLRLSHVDATGAMLGHFKDISIVAPRGNHDLQFFPSGLQLRGKSQTYLIKWTSIRRIFCVDMPDGAQKMLVLGLSQPLRNGNMQYSLIGMKIATSAVVDTATAVPQAAWDAAKSKGLQKSRDNLPPCQDEEAPKWEVVASLLKELSEQKVLQPANFKAHDKKGCLPCTLMTDRGHLFFFGASLLFAPKPLTWKRFAELEGIEFQKGMLRENTFDLILSWAHERPMEFKQIEKENEKILLEFFEEKAELKDKIKDVDEVRKRVQKSSDGKRKAAGAPLPEEDAEYEEEEDDDFQADAPSDCEESEGDDGPVSPAPKKKLRSHK
ncbi:unnamed protein product [Effrenium voratum]|nr:unnamed protein product [Effrenium voratum]